MDLIKKSLHVLKNLQLKNGCILASPENGSYPYLYPRDSVIITKAFNAYGLYRNSEKFYYFMNKISKLDRYGEIFQRYNKDGLPCVTRKHEHDNTGLVIHGIYDTYLHNKNDKFLEKMYPFVKKCVRAIFSFLKDGLIQTERSIHEFYRLENGYEIWSNCSCCRGLYDASEIAKILGYREYKKWKKEAKKLEENIKIKMFNRRLGIFVKNLRLPEITDISQLSPFYFNISNSKEILKKTLKILEKHLWHKKLGGFRRFKKFEVCKDWHWYTGGSGSWIMFTAWAARFYKKIGNKKYKKCLRWIEKIALRTNGLIPEHVSTKKEYEMWKANEIEFSNRVVMGMKIAEKEAKKFKSIVCWAAPHGWSQAEYLLSKNFVFKN